MVSAGTLACLVPAGAWTLLVLALGLAASSLAHAAALACWSERATPESTAAGAAAGLVVFVFAAGAGALGRDAALWWGSIGAAGPAALAAPAHLLVAWLLRSRGAPSPRLSAPLPVRPPAG